MSNEMSINEIIEDFSELGATQKLTLQIENTKLKLYSELII
jgi:hypothetical protein